MPAFDPQPRLVGDLLELRPLRESDWPALYGVASDPLIWEQHPASDRWKEPVFRKFFEDAIKSGGALVAVERASGRIIGSSRFHAVAEPGEIEIGWTFLARRCWGGRYNGEMKRLMLTHVFRDFERVAFLIGETNTRSQKAIERIGAVKRSTLEPRPGGPNVRSFKYVLERPKGA